MSDREQLSDKDALARLLGGADTTSFGNGFEERAVGRWARQSTAASRRSDWGSALQSQFVRVAPLAAAAVFALAVINVRAAGEYGQSMIEAALDLPAVNLANAYSADLFLPVAQP